MPKTCYLIGCLLLTGVSCTRPSDVSGHLDQTLIDQLRDRNVRTFGHYAVIKLPIQKGVTLWNPVQVTRGPDGLMYVSNNTGEIFALEDTDGDGLEDYARLFCDVRHDSLRSPASIIFKGVDLYVGTAQEIRVYRDRNGDRQADTSYAFFENVPHSEHPYEWISGLTFGRDSALYAAITTDSWNAGAAPDPKGWRGALLRIAPDGSAAERFATGLRSVPAMILSPDDSLLFIDNEGGGNQNEELNVARVGHFYGHNPDKYGSPPVTEAILNFQTDVAPSGMTFNDSTNSFDNTAGDLFIGFYGPGERWTRGSIGRVRIHKKEDGSYDLEEFPVIAGLPKVSDLEFGFNGDLYVTQVGKTDYWYQALDEPDGAVFRIIYARWVTPASPEMESDVSPTTTNENYDRGKELFTDLGCFACHSVDGKSELLGPDLKDIGRVYSREELLEEIMYPSRRIKPSMAPTRLLKSNGEVLVGRVVSTSPQEVRLMVAGNRIVAVSRTTIKREESVMESLMWEGLLEGLGDDDVESLLDYLISLHLKNE